MESALKNLVAALTEDSRIIVIKVIPAKGYYWDSKYSKFVAFAKIAVSAVSDKTLDDSIEEKSNL